MRLQTFARVILVVPVLALACANEGPVLFHGPEAGGGTVTFALDAAGYEAGASPFKVKLYKGRPASLSAKPYFDSGCTGASLGFAIDDLATGSDYVVVYEAFSTADCAAANRIALGIRGGVEVTKAGTPEGVYYYLQVNALGAVTGFPVPGSQLDPPTTAGAVTCKVDDDCRALEECANPDDPVACRFKTTVSCVATDTGCKDGKKVLKYRFHPQGVCDAAVKICRLSSLYPLNAETDRAFHVAVSGVGGDVALLGGFNWAGGEKLVVNRDSTDVEAFGVNTCLFTKVDPPMDLDVGLGFPALVNLDGRRVLMIGGTQTIPLKNFGGALLPAPGLGECKAGTCPVALSPHLFVVDVAAGRVVQSDTTWLTAGALATLVDAAGLTRVFVRPGVYQKDAASDLVGGTTSYVCDVTDSAVKCSEVANSSKAPARVGAAGACMAANGDRCSKYLVVGGAAADASFGEVFDAQANLLTPLQNDASLPVGLTGAVAVAAGGKIWTVGGRIEGKAVTGVYSYALDGTGTKLVATSAALSAQDQADLSRVYHQATVLADGVSVLVTGGVAWGAGQAAPTDSAMLLKVKDGQMTVVGRLNGLSVPRVGHAATLIVDGLLKGGVLISGGMDVLSGTPTFAAGVDLFLPAVM